jgi:hypothetical protein
MMSTSSHNLTGSTEASCLRWPIQCAGAYSLRLIKKTNFAPEPDRAKDADNTEPRLEASILKFVQGVVS